MATTSITRSTRRTEGHQPLATNTRRNHSLVNYGTTGTGTKRQLDSSDAEYVFKPKKPRLMGISVEIPARPSVALARNTAGIDTKPPHPPSQSRPTVADSKRPTSRSAPFASGALSTVAQRTTATTKPARPPKHLGRTAAALKNELNSLQPAQDIAKDQGRKLRSQEATRFKSELSAYFPEYDEVIGNDPKARNVLHPETSILLTDSRPKLADRPSTVDTQPSSAENDREPRLPRTYPVRRYSDALFTDLFDAQTIDFSFLEARYTGKSLDDTLPDSVFEPAHKKAERLERSIRNSEKGRAQHEKDQIIRLLGGLEGHDWLRVMGVSGVTESRKKTFEPARDHFIKGCQSILEKFRAWAAEEKRRKRDKDKALAYARKESEHRTDGEVDAAEQFVEVSDAQEDQDVDGEDGEARSEGDPPDSDIDASIAKQLQEEAFAAANKRSRRGHGANRPLSPPESQTPRAFTSFFDKKYQRDAALSKNRRRGRSVLAWGHAVPDMEEAEFVLPEEYRDEDTLKVQARRKRKQKRDKH